MAYIKVSSDAILEKANSFKAIAGAIRTYTDDMKKTVESLRSVWEGFASDETQTAFNKLQGTFDEKYDTITKFSTFLEDTAEVYRRTEEVNAKN